jgi:2-oxoglutarate ferredoxin oxidoreductase subunit delta
MTNKKCKVIVKKDYCKACGLCINFCKKEVLKFSENFNIQGYHYAEQADGKDCSGCMICVTVCPEVSIEVYDG